jgi:hypothetical protein
VLHVFNIHVHLSRRGNSRLLTFASNGVSNGRFRKGVSERDGYSTYLEDNIVLEDGNGIVHMYAGRRGQLLATAWGGGGFGLTVTETETA